MQSIKCVIVGESGTGKTYLLYTYVNKVFPKEYIPGFHPSYVTQITVDGQTVSLDLHDSAGKKEYDQLRSLHYPQTNIVIICFSISNPSSYENVTQRWVPEIKRYCPNVPVLLVGTKSDLRDNQEVLEKLREQNQTPVTKAEGVALAKKIKAVKYLECASVNQEGLEELFDEAAHAHLSHQQKKTCVLL